MCTVSWLYEGDGYHLLSNRDERKSRAKGLGPQILDGRAVRFIAPVDPDGGGTWIAVNEVGLSCCLLNGATLTHRTTGSTLQAPRSRGLLVRDLSDGRSAKTCLERLWQMDLTNYAAFTLVILQPGRLAALAEWDGTRRTVVLSSEHYRLLASSSIDPRGVREFRESEFARQARRAKGVDLQLLSQFHSSHCGRRDAYSPCMHRADAETVSFSRIVVTRHNVRLSYSAAAPCETCPEQKHSLPRSA